MNNEYLKVDLAYLAEMSAGDLPLAQELIQLFNEQMIEMQTQMENALSEKNWDQLARMAHKAKASVMMMGLKKVAEDLKQLETFAKQGKNIEIYNEIVVRFVDQTNEIMAELSVVAINPEKYFK